MRPDEKNVFPKKKLVKKAGIFTKIPAFLLAAAAFPFPDGKAWFCLVRHRVNQGGTSMKIIFIPKEVPNDAAQPSIPALLANAILNKH